MKIPKMQKMLKKAGVFDIAKLLHRYFPDVSTKRINDLILQVDSVDLAVDVLFENRNDSTTSINDLVFLVLKWKDDQK